MRLTVLGPTGGTGQELVRRALDAGHEVIAVARRPEAVAARSARLRVVPGDIADPAWAGDGIVGADAVLSALGSRALGQPTTLYSAGAVSVLTAMSRAGVRRLVVVTAAPVAPDGERPPFERIVVDPILRRFFGEGYKDMRRMEELLGASDADWTVFRPPALTNGPYTARYRTAVGRALPRAWTLSRADLAAAMIAAVEDPSLVRRSVAIAR